MADRGDTETEHLVDDQAQESKDPGSAGVDGAAEARGWRVTEESERAGADEPDRHRDRVLFQIELGDISPHK